LSESVNNIPDAGNEGLLVMKTPSARSKNESVQQAQRDAKMQRLQKNLQATEDFVKQAYPNEIWISKTATLQGKNEWTEGLVIPKNVKIAKSRIPHNKNDSEILEKELIQARILSKLGNVVYFTPEPGDYKKRVTDAVVNGTLFEFRTITGSQKKVESEFGDAKRKGKNINVFLNIEANTSKAEARRRIGLVLGRHPDFTGKIVVSFRGGKPYFWDTSSFR
jgi:hypothetical protein